MKWILSDHKLEIQKIHYYISLKLIIEVKTYNLVSDPVSRLKDKQDHKVNLILIL